jgi:NAD(P)H-hydrate epimerase
MKLPPILYDASKYSRGSLLVLAGSQRFVGAAVLCARAAARTGAGYVTLAVPASVAPIAQAHLLSIPVIAAAQPQEAPEQLQNSKGPKNEHRPESKGVFAPEGLSDILSAVTHINAIVCGPGLTSAPEALAFAAQVAKTVSVPVLLDADALRAVGSMGVGSMADRGVGSPQNRPLLADDGTAPLILTPHAGELQRLLAATGAKDTADLARITGAVVVAKGPETLIVSPSQSQLFTAGTPALATAGTGDVLSGIIGSLLAQGTEPYEAACIGVQLHSQAGRIAEQHFGTRSVMAEDVIEALAEVIQKLDSSLGVA